MGAPSAEMAPDRLHSAIRLTFSRAVAAGTLRGWRIANEKTSRKIDVVVTLAYAALGAVRQSSNDGSARDFLVPTVRNFFEGTPPGDPLTRGDPLLSR